MHRRDAAKLGRLLAAADPPPAVHDAAGACNLCQCDLVVREGDRIVEVKLRPGADRPEAWLCRACYGYVVGDLGIAPTRVFKSGRHRSVVLPIGPDGRDARAGSD